ncbi:hypothetical protein AWW66_02655 [Micromonospora rosaria]|uniref:Uncharacterized protein n=1 Tax=Micromonospora rosaria TaxID=47874 RepID=A0A136PYB2_9ACTN|nr:hypothetical protein [Micromonospora rosaria]KXK63460.1 hypothetical protein AWW66_02655 [Micromonospora rosaria]
MGLPRPLHPVGPPRSLFAAVARRAVVQSGPLPAAIGSAGSAAGPPEARPPPGPPSRRPSGWAFRRPTRRGAAAHSARRPAARARPGVPSPARRGLSCGARRAVAVPNAGV